MTHAGRLSLISEGTSWQKDGLMRSSRGSSCIGSAEIDEKSLQELKAFQALLDAASLGTLGKGRDGLEF